MNEKNGTAGVITLDSLLNAPIETPNDGSDATQALQDALKADEVVLPGLDDIDPIEEPVKKPEVKIENEEEEEEVDPLSVLEKEPEKNTEVAELASSTLYKDTLKSIWGDEIGSIITEVDGEEREVSLDELELDQETFMDILKSKIEDIKESATKGKISVEGVSEFTQALIEIDKNGGDTRSLLEVKNAYLDPLANLDLENPEDQKEVIYLRAKAAGQDDEDIYLLLEQYEAKGLLEAKANEAEAVLRQAVDAQVQAELQKSEQEKAQREEAFKQYKKELKDNIGKQFELKDSIKTKLVDMSTKLNDKGRYSILKRRLN
jgi:hypothetical protein